MEIDKKEVEHICQLVRIDLTSESIEKFSRELSHIIDYVGELDLAPTENIEEIDQILGLENISREDKIEPGLGNDKALMNAPDQENGFIKVKKILE
jgi:aspartyl-tRNA(Asn)/glutamyl-tRNA(Gln) amidotransferase subunit C